MNRISGKPLKTRGSGTLVVTGIPCLLLGLRKGSMGAAVTDGHSGHKSDPSVAVLTPAAKGLTPMAVNMTPVVTVLTPPLVQCDPSVWRTSSIRLKRNSFLSIMELWQGRGCDNLTAIHS